MRTWGNIEVPQRPQWLSHIGQDHAPFEFSVSFVAGRPRIRLLVEAQSETGRFPAVRDACLGVQSAAMEYGADGHAFERVRDLFLPEVPHAPFALWHAASISSGPMFVKAYLNPQIRGPEHAEVVVQTALERLGLRGAWSNVRSSFWDHELSGDEIRYFSLDLVEPARARTKVYVYPAGATAWDLERLASLRKSYVPGEVTEFCRAMTGSTGPYVDRAVCVYFAFTGTDPNPSDVTIQVPMAAYVQDDEVARDRILRYFRARGLPTTAYERALSAVSQRPLGSGRGLHTYVSLRTGRQPLHLTVYFAAELYGVQQPPRIESVPAAMSA
ncbi:hypothetical protein LZC95_32485 [Pendulispora brunnea]|uniref:Uncharacterized protein n=1 Tax=Pendulispora brunnea TaxID=2905690 RepID=A0ABZ2K480_9BACT